MARGRVCHRPAAEAALALSEDVGAGRRLSESATRRRQLYGGELTPYAPAVLLSVSTFHMAAA